MKTIELLALLVKAALCLASLCGSADAAAPVVRITQVGFERGQQVMNYWSGTVIGRMQSGELAILTCAHEYNQAAPVSVEVDARPVPGRIVALDRAADLGGIAVPYDPATECYAVSPLPVPAGTEVYAIGYREGSQLRSRITQIREFSRGKAVIETTFIPGESGGPLVHKGLVVGVIVQTDDPRRMHPSVMDFRGYAVRQEAIAPFVVQTFGRVQATAANRPVLVVFTRPDCPPCAEFERDYRAGMYAAYDVRKCHWDGTAWSDPALAAEYAAVRPDEEWGFPTFWVRGTSARHVGYGETERKGGLLQWVAGVVKTVIGGAGNLLIGEPQPAPRPALPKPATNPDENPQPYVRPPAAPPSAPSTSRDGEPGAGSLDPADVTVVVLVKNTGGTVIRGVGSAALERLINGQVRRQVEEAIGGKVDFRVVFERSAPTRHAAVIDAAGVAGESVIEVIVLVKKRFTGVSGLVVGIVGKVFKSRIEEALSKAPVEVVLERIAGDTYAAVLDATEVVEPAPEPSGDDAGGEKGGDPVTGWDWSLGGIYALLRSIRKRMEKPNV